ncbi:MAG TPA: hypothetical protein VGP43_06080 [Chitinophagaceae bacterium]|nr:hypothetical protein [Chitinophagaceae bacterium]
MLKHIIIIITIALITSSCDSNNKKASNQDITKKEFSNTATKEETEDFISEKLSEHSLPWKTGAIQVSKENAFFRNDSLMVESNWQYDGTNRSDRIVVSTKNKNIGETVRQSDSTFLIKYLDRPVTGIIMKIDYNTEKNFEKDLIKAFDHLKSFYKKSENVDSESIKFWGEWNGTDYTGASVTLILDKTGHATIVGKNQVLGGDIEKDGMQLECIYEIDHTKNPIWLDISIRKKGEEDSKAIMKGIVRFITESKIEYRYSDYRSERFKTFNFKDTKNTIVFDKATK